jgi:hypothetical protein
MVTLHASCILIVSLETTTKPLHTRNLSNAAQEAVTNLLYKGLISPVST